MFNRILVPLDGSMLAERALPHAEQFARIFGSNIILLQVLDPTSYHENPNPVDPLGWQIRKAEADMYMNGVTMRLRKNLGETPADAMSRGSGDGNESKTRVEYFIREGKTAENIVNFAYAENIDLLVISSHGSGGLSRWNLSSVTQKVIGQIYLPVLIVRAYNQPENEEARVHYHRILLPIDSSRRAECVFPAGVALARGEMAMGVEPETPPAFSEQTPLSALPPQTKLVLVTVMKSPELPVTEPYPVEIEQLIESLRQVSRQTAQHYLNEMKARLSVKCEVIMVENKSVCSAIHEIASHEGDIDLVLLCAHGYTGQSKWPYGSIARNYIEYGTKPVLVIQDVLRSQVQPTFAEITAEKDGGR